MMTTAANMVPILRFGEFSGEWYSDRLREAAGVFDGTHQTPKYTDGGVPFMSVENVTNPYKKMKFISPEAFERDFKNKPKAGDILMTRITAGIIGATAVVENNEPLGYYVSLALIRCKHGHNPVFVRFQIEGQNFKKELNKRIIHVAFPKKINLGDLGSCSISFPSLPEQTKIANFLTSVDDRIRQLTEKKALLEEYKKGVMQQLFSQAIRFKDDDGNDFPDWEEKKLGKICKITTGKLDANAMNPTGQYRFYTCAKDYLQIDNYAFDTEALLISGNGANVGYIHYYKGKFNAYQRTYVLDSFDEVISFIKFQLEVCLYRRIQLESKAGNIPYIVLGTLTELPLSLPTLPEQTKIANFLSAIDHKIESVATQITETQTFKRGLLQQMFV